MELMLNKLYALQDDGEHDHIRIIEGPYKDIEYAYGRVQFLPDSESGTMVLDFEYAVINNPTTIDLEASNGFNDTISNILVELLDIKYGKGGVAPEAYEDSDDGDMIESDVVEGEVIEVYE